MLLIAYLLQLTPHHLFTVALLRRRRSLGHQLKSLHSSQDDGMSHCTARADEREQKAKQHAFPPLPRMAKVFFFHFTRTSLQIGYLRPRYLWRLDAIDRYRAITIISHLEKRQQFLGSTASQREVGRQNKTCLSVDKKKDTFQVQGFPKISKKESS